jgi:hypothetical protein
MPDVGDTLTTSAQPPAGMLHGLVVSLFSAEEFRCFLRQGPECEVLDALPGMNASAVEVIGQGLDALERRGRIDAAFFERLQEARSGRTEAIRRVAELWSQRVAPAPVAQTRGADGGRSAAARWSSLRISAHVSGLLVVGLVAVEAPTYLVALAAMGLMTTLGVGTRRVSQSAQVSLIRAGRDSMIELASERVEVARVVAARDVKIVARNLP